MGAPLVLMHAPCSSSPASCGGRRRRRRQRHHHHYHTYALLTITISSIPPYNRTPRRAPPRRLLLSSSSSFITLPFKPLKLQAVSSSIPTTVVVANVKDSPDVSLPFLMGRLDEEDASSQARQLLALSVKLGVCFVHVIVANKLTALLAFSLLLEYARQLFDRIRRRSFMTYHLLISSYCQRQLWEGAFDIFALMIADGYLADKYLLRKMLKACSSTESLELGKIIHGHVMRRDLDLDFFLCGALIEMYAKCGSLDSARKALMWVRKCLLGDGSGLMKEVHDRGAVIYAPLITSYCREERWADALGMLALMVADGFSPDKFLFPSVLKACSAIESLASGMVIHGYVIRRELKFDVFIGNALIDMYVKCGSLDRAKKVFYGMPLRDVVSWTVMISAYAEVGLLGEAMECFELMGAAGVVPDVIAWNALIAGSARFGDILLALGLLDEMRMSGLRPGVGSWNGIISGCAWNGDAEDALLVFRQMQLYEKPNTITISSILAALSDMNCLQLGKEVHAYAIRCGMESNVFVSGSTIGMYLKCGKREHARKIFVSMPDRNSTIWNEMIASYANEGSMDHALEFVDRMRSSGVGPDLVTYNTLLASYALAGEKDQAFKAFSDMILMGLKPNIVTLNALISGFQQCGQSIEALKLFRCMQLSFEMTSDDHPSVLLLSDGESNNLFGHVTSLGMRPDAITMTSALAACADLKKKKQGKQIHAYVLRNWLDSNVFVTSALVDMYAKCHDMSSATKTFCRIADKNTVSWNSLMAGYNQNAQPQSALKLFPNMLEDGVTPSPITIILLLSACSTTMALKLGRELHGYAVKSDFYHTSALASTLIDMYAKCGSIKDARQTFDCTTTRDATLWNVIISGYAMHGMARDALILFQEMESSGVKPNHITFTAVLSACSHGGLVQEGWTYFTSMERFYEITPTLEHHTCIVGILGRAGLLNEALEFITKMPFEPDACLWSTLLRACRIHSNVEVGEEAAKALFQLEPTNAANYIILANIYATTGMWDSSKRVREWMDRRGVTTVKECSRIEMNQKTKFFEAGDLLHPEMEEILETWDKLAGQMQETGYFPCEVCFEGSNAGFLDPFSCFHTEKFAICYGISVSHDRSPIRVIKNLRMCIDCHTSAKFISRIIGRDILVRDGCFYHHFKGGSCSCNDKW